MRLKLQCSYCILVHQSRNHLINLNNIKLFGSYLQDNNRHIITNMSVYNISENYQYLNLGLYIPLWIRIQRK
jgi:hypothetical protein